MSSQPFGPQVTPVSSTAGASGDDRAIGSKDAARGCRWYEFIACSIRDTPPGSVLRCDGRSPDSRVLACPAFPCPPKCSVVTVAVGVARRLQLRGQSRIWRLLPTPHRIPFSPGRAWFGREPSASVWPRVSGWSSRMPPDFGTETTPLRPKAQCHRPGTPRPQDARRLGRRVSALPRPVPWRFC
jgi:hypothetical protein